ncbi:MAG: hypothetical protein WBM46_19595 [Polyangiales bacterium]
MDEATRAPLDGITGHKNRRRPGSPVDPYRLQRALWGGRFRLIAGAVTSVAVGYLVVKLFMLSPYQTTVILKYQGVPALGDGGTSDYELGPASEALVLQSVLQKIREETGFEGSLNDLAAAIDYELDFRAGTLRFSVLGKTAEDAKAFAGIVTDVFLAYHKEQESRRIEDKLARTSSRIAAAQSEAEQARTRYNRFREEHGISSLSIEQDSMVRSAASLRANSELATWEIRALEARIRSLETQLASIPKTSVVSDGSSPERAIYDQLRQELASAKASLSPEHPQVRSLQHQVDQLRAQLGTRGGESSSGSGLASPNSTYQAVEMQLREARMDLEVLRVRQEGLSGMADKAQRRVEGFSDVEAEASALLADVSVRENLLSGLHRTKALLEDALRDPPSGFVVLDPGAAPELPIRNKTKVIVFVMFSVIGSILALLFVLYHEFRGLRLKTPLEVAFWGNAPVLAATSWPEDPQGLDELVASFDDVVPEARGDLLILGALPSEEALARELADRMSDDWFPVRPDTAPRTAPVITTPPPRGPLQTPPPAGPYPIRPLSEPPRRPSMPPAASAIQLSTRAGDLQLRAWDGPFEGQALRRAARLADRVLIVVRSGAMSALQLHGVRHRIGREAGIAYLVVGLPLELRAVSDRAGNVGAFWGS